MKIFITFTTKLTIAASAGKYSTVVHTIGLRCYNYKVVC